MMIVKEIQFVKDQLCFLKGHVHVIFKILTLKSYVEKFITLKDMRISGAIAEHDLAVETVCILHHN